MNESTATFMDLADCIAACDNVCFGMSTDVENENRSSVLSAHSFTLKRKLKVIEENQHQMDIELEAETILKRREMEMKWTTLKRRAMLERQIREEEEEQENGLQMQILQDRRLQLERMKARHRMFEDDMESMDLEMTVLKNFMGTRDKQSSVPEVVNEDSEESSDRSFRKVKKNIESNKKRKKLVNLEENGLGQAFRAPSKMQLAARNGMSQKLPIFSGKPEEWPLFYGAFQASNEACGYSNVENLVRLQECIKGPALELVRGQLLLPKSVPRVIEKLRQLYGRPEQLLQSHLEKLRCLKPPNSGSLGSFIPFGTAVEQLCEHLEAAEMKQHLINPLLIQELVAKLPDNDKRAWVRFKRGNKKITLRTFSNFVSEIVSEACEANIDIDYSSTCRLSSSDVSEKPYREDNVMYDSDSKCSVLDMQEWFCQVCQQTDHQLQHCEDFQNMCYADRMKVVDHFKLCHRCLIEHGKVSCDVEVWCNIEDCRQPHNPLLHRKSSSIGTSAHIKSKNNVLFRMIPVKLHCGESPVSTLAFLDEGSSVTLIEQNLSDRLLAVGVHEELTIEWTSGIERVERNSKRIDLHVSAKGVHDKMLLKTVHTVDNLNLPTQSFDAKETLTQCEHLRGLPISSYSGRPEILIGVNNIHSFAPIDSRIGRLSLA